MKSHRLGTLIMAQEIFDPASRRKTAKRKFPAPAKKPRTELFFVQLGDDFHDFLNRRLLFAKKGLKYLNFF